MHTDVCLQMENDIQVHGIVGYLQIFEQHEMTLTESSVASHVRRQALDLHALNQRCEEEIGLIKKDMASVLSYYKQMLLILMGQCDEAVTTQYDKARKAVLMNRISQTKQKLNDTCALFGDVIDVSHFSVQDSEGWAVPSCSSPSETIFSASSMSDIELESDNEMG